MNQSDQPTSSKLPSIFEKFAIVRKQFSSEIYDGIKLLENIKNIPEAQIIFLSLRQRLLEENHVLIENFTQLKKLYREKKGEEWIDSSKNSQIRYSSNEKATIVDGKTASIKERLELVENQIDFYSESIKTVDAVLYGIKSRIDVQRLLDGN